MKQQTIALCFGLIALLAQSALAQTLTSRSSSLNFNYVYGAGADTHVDSAQRTRTTPLSTDTDAMSFLGSTSGTLPNGEPYSAGAECHLQYDYTITGSPLEIAAISASASSQVLAATTGLGSAVMHAANPGNEIVLHFTTYRDISYRLSGSITLPFSSAFSYVALQRFNGFNWEYVFYSAFLPNGQGAFDQSGILVAGDYRIWSAISISAGANQNYAASYNYLLDLPGLGGCIADFNHDAIIDFNDYLDFVDAFASNAPAADINLDSIVDFNDYLDFVNALSTGC